MLPKKRSPGPIRRSAGHGPATLERRRRPLLDGAQRVVGVNTRSATATSVGLDLAVPVHCFEEALARFAGPAEEVLKAAPRYGCAECDATIRPDDTRCSACGARILYLDEPVYAPPDWIRAQAAVERFLQAKLGLRPKTISVGRGAWLVESKAGEILFYIADEGEAVEQRTRIARVPAGDQDAFLRFALAANDVAVGDARLWLRDDTLELSRQESTRGLESDDAVRGLKDFGAAAMKLRALFERAFRAPPPLSFGQDRMK